MAARGGGTYLFVTIAADWRTGSVRDRHIIPKLVRKRGRLPRWREELFPSVSGQWCGGKQIWQRGINDAPSAARAPLGGEKKTT
jgi:hypothetical protein